MSVSFDIQSAACTYTVHIEVGLFQKIIQAIDSEVVIADDWFISLLLQRKIPSILLAANEATKNLNALPDLIAKLREANVTRQTRLLALGGGVIQDVTAFAASIYMRGVQWRYLPTTLLAMTDSCIGGKSSINVGPYKNLVGTFHPPTSIVIDPALVLTLTDEQRVSGLVEAAKICYCHGTVTFDCYLALSPNPSMSVEQLEQLITLSLQSKKWFIEIDEFDKKERLTLNFGHTFGHAIESASNFRISHGLGVAIGILCIAELGCYLGRSYDGARQVHLLIAHLRRLLTFVPELKEELQVLSTADILDCFRADKKHEPEWYSVILMASSGEVELLKMPKNDQSRRAIEESISRTLRKLC
jgi:3-dehydroquinate synthase